MPADYTEISAQRVTAIADAAIREADAIVDRLAQAGARAGATAGAESGATTSSGHEPAGPGELTFETAVLPLDRAWAVIADAEGASGFLSYVHPDLAVRDAAQAAEERIRRWRVQVAFRDDVYETVRAFSELPAAGALAGERRRLLDFWLRDFRRAGHALDREQRAELESLRGRLVELEVAFQRTIDDYHDWLDLTPDELDGLPPHYLARLRPGERPGTKRVSLDYPEIIPFLEQARRRDLRETMERSLEWTRRSRFPRAGSASRAGRSMRSSSRWPGAPKPSSVSTGSWCRR